MPEDFDQKIKRLLRQFDQASKVKVHEGNKEAVVSFEGQQSPGGLQLQELARGLMTRHFKNAHDGGPAEHIEFRSGTTTLDGRMLNGIVVAADPMNLPGAGQGYGGKVDVYKDGERVDSGVFSANVRTAPAGP